MILKCSAVANPEVVKTVSCFYKVNVVARYVFNTLNVCKIQDTVFYWSKDDVTFSGQVKTDKEEEF